MVRRHLFPLRWPHHEGRPLPRRDFKHPMPVARGFQTDRLQHFLRHPERLRRRLLQQNLRSAPVRLLRWRWRRWRWRRPLTPSRHRVRRCRARMLIYAKPRTVVDGQTIFNHTRYVSHRFLCGLAHVCTRLCSKRIVKHNLLSLIDNRFFKMSMSTVKKSVKIKNAFVTTILWGGRLFTFVSQHF